MVNKVINKQQLKAICDVLGETNQGFTKTELNRLLQQCGIKLVSDGSYLSFGKKSGSTYS